MGLGTGIENGDADGPDAASLGDVVGKSLGSGSGRSDWRPLGDVVANPVI